MWPINNAITDSVTSAYLPTRDISTEGSQGNSWGGCYLDCASLQNVPTLEWKRRKYIRQLVKLVTKREVVKYILVKTGKQKFQHRQMPWCHWMTDRLTKAIICFMDIWILKRDFFQELRTRKINAYGSVRKFSRNRSTDLQKPNTEEGYAYRSTDGVLLAVVRN